jgi:protein PhnA
MPDTLPPDTLPLCPNCASDLAYEMGALLVCPMCGHEWAPVADAVDEAEGGRVVRDAVGTVLADGDTVTILKDLKVKGSGGNVLKVGTKVRNIRLIDGVGDHDIDCKIDGFGSMQLKSSVVKKS